MLVALCISSAMDLLTGDRSIGDLVSLPLIYTCGGKLTTTIRLSCLWDKCFFIAEYDLYVSMNNIEFVDFP